MEKKTSELLREADEMFRPVYDEMFGEGSYDKGITPVSEIEKDELAFTFDSNKFIKEMEEHEGTIEETLLDYQEYEQEMCERDLKNDL